MPFQTGVFTTEALRTQRIFCFSGDTDKQKQSSLTVPSEGKTIQAWGEPDKFRSQRIVDPVVIRN
jgi:hypothetical protein